MDYFFSNSSLFQSTTEKLSLEKFQSGFGWGRTRHLSSDQCGDIAPVVFTNYATETNRKKIVQIALIKLTDAAVHLVFKSLNCNDFRLFLSKMLHNPQQKI